MPTTAGPRDGAKNDQVEQPGFGIIGVGILTLPTSLASYGPITLVSMGLTTVGALALAPLFAADAGRDRRCPSTGESRLSEP